MSDFAEFQKQFIEEIKKKLPLNHSLVHEIAETLHMSIDSAYRRMRGQTTFSFEEVKLLSSRFAISVDGLLGGDTDKVSFSYKPFDEKSYDLHHFLKNIHKDLNSILHGKAPYELLSTTNEITLFQALMIPEVAAFKTFFWSKVILGHEKLQLIKFDLTEQVNFIKPISEDIANTYVSIPTLDLLNDNMFNQTLRQIRYFIEANLFKYPEEAFNLCQKLLQMVDHMEREAELGYKFKFCTEPKTGKDKNYEMYVSNVIFPDNILLVKQGERLTEYIAVNSVNFIKTNDQNFCQDTLEHIEGLTKKSKRVSSYAKKGKNKFFLKMRNKINLFIEDIS